MAFRDLLPAKWTGENKVARRDVDFPFSAWERHMSRMFDDFISGFDPEFTDVNGGWGMASAPRADVSETDKEIEITVDLPGLDEKDVDVMLSNGVLTIRGEKKSEHEDQGKNFFRRERSFGSFQRSISLPAEVDTEKVDATFKKGVLHVKLPKTEAALQKKVTVKAAE